MTNNAEIVEARETMPADPMVSMIERVASDPNSDIAKLERMLEMKERHDAQQAKVAFDKAFARASAEFPDIPQNGINTHNGQTYSTLKDILSNTRPVLSRFGFALSFSTDFANDQVVVTAELSHEYGHSKRNSLPLPRDTGPGRNQVQAIGSSQTYGQRYTAQAILGLSLGEDTEDDGNTSGKPQERPGRARYSWAAEITKDMPENSTPREKAEAVADALCRQWNRMKGERQIFNEWDRRANIIEGDRGLEGLHPDLHEKVVDAYEIRVMEIKDAAK